MNARRLTLTTLASLCALAGGLLFASAPALAAPPAIEGESFSNVDSSSATLSATVNAGGSLSSYRFEYGTSVPYSAVTPTVSLGSASTGVSVLAQLGGLQPETVYHFRVVVTNAKSETAPGADATFTTLPIGIFGLPDNRGYEMVSPVANQDGNVYVPTSNPTGNSEHGIPTDRPFQASADGSAVVYVAAPTSSGNGSEGQGGGNEYLAMRAPGGGWTVNDIQPPGLNSPVYLAFTSDLSVGILESGALLSANAPAGYNVLYTRVTGDGSSHPLFTTTPPNRPPGELETPVSGGYSRSLGTGYAGASSDLSHLLFEANDALTPNAVDGGRAVNNLYDSVNGQLRLVNVLPNGTTEANATFGFQPPEAEVEVIHDFSHVISADGSRIFWTDLNTGDLYVRENDAQPQSPLGPKGECAVPADACTVQVDASVGGGGQFWTASADGSKVFFTRGDLYEYDISSGQTIDLAPGASVQGVVGTSDDGSYVYFVADGVLALWAAHGDCSNGESSIVGCNLYVYHSGVTMFIATLSFRDGKGGGNGGGTFGDWQPGVGYHTAEVTPDGRSVVFISSQSVTGYANEGQREVYVYDAGAGRLSCASCNPSGEPAPPPAFGGGVFEYGAYLPFTRSNVYLSRFISEDGSRVFFNTAQALVSQDNNGQVDAYEWERNGAHGCQRSAGCIYLLSGGTSTDNSYFVDASASGNDAFIITRAQLVSQDQNETFDLYDVRVGAPQPPSPPACSGTGCQGVPPAPPIFATPSSVTFNGVGNFAPPAKQAVKPKKKSKRCKRGSVRKRGRCVKKKAKTSKKSAVGRK